MFNDETSDIASGGDFQFGKFIPFYNLLILRRWQPYPLIMNIVTNNDKTITCQIRCALHVASAQKPVHKSRWKYQFIFKWNDKSLG